MQMTDDKTQRPFAKFYRAIWADDEFKSLDSGPQRMFMLLLSQPTITLAGTMPLQVNKWSRLATDTPSELLREHLAALTERCFVVVDEDTEELLIRTVMKNDTLWNRSPKTQLGVLRHCLKVESPLIRLTLADEIESCLSMFTTANDVDQQAHTALSALREHASEHGSEHASANHQVKQPKSPPPADTEHASEHASEHVSKLPHTSYLIPHTSDRTSSETYVGKGVVGGNPYQRAYNCVQEPDDVAADPWADVPDPSRSTSEPPSAGLDEKIPCADCSGWAEPDSRLCGQCAAARRDQVAQSRTGRRR